MLKHVFLFLGFLGSTLSWGLVAQTTVTLTVDMSNQTVSPDGVHVAGSFQGWDPGATPMTDNGDGTWSHTFTSDMAAYYQYKFINGNAWGWDESIPDACAVDGTRQIEVDGMMGDLESSVCFGRCVACDQSAVLFRVDMSNEEVSLLGVHVAGDFQGWDPGATELNDPDGDMIYERLVALPSDITSIAYKFINGNNWTDINELLDGACADMNGSRTLEVGNETDITLSANAAGDAYCFNQCTSCILPLQVTFTIDMSQVASVSEAGVHLAGTFQGWDPGATPLSDNGDGIWSVTLEIHPGYHEFKFINGNEWFFPIESMGGTECSGTNDGTNRGASFDEANTSYECCFNACPGVFCVPDPEPANLTFQVDASEVDLGGESMFIFGAFTGWQGGAIEMTDNGDGTWQTTQLVSGSTYVDYKYSIGVPTNQGNDESGEYVLGVDIVNFEMEGCGVSNGFGGFNRRFVRSGVDEVVPLHCFNSCSACLGDGGCTDTYACNYDATAMTDDGSCFYPGDACDDGYDMTVNDVVNDVCECVGEEIVMGCMDTLACNYDSEANVDDGSCGTDCAGCTDIHAVNFDPGATKDDGSCEFWSPSCDACQSNFDFGGAPFGVSPDPTLGQSFTDGHLGLPYTDAWHVLVPPTAAGIDSTYPPELDVDSVIVMADMVSGSGEYIGVVFTDTTTMEDFHAGDLGLSFVLNNQGDSPNPTTLLGGNQYCALLSGTPTRAGVYRMAVGIEVWATIIAPFSVPYVLDNFMLTIDDAGEGCTDSLACNYVDALVDDGSCLYPGDPCDDCNSATTTDTLNDCCQCVGENGLVEGCTDVNACNYDPNADVDDGSCWQSLGGEPALLFGTWKLSPEAGAIAIGPEPGSTQWYAAPVGWQNCTVDSNIDFQTDDRWTFTPEGEFIYDSNGSTMNPFEGFSETPMTVEPTAYALEAGAGLNGNDVFTVDNMNTEVAEICGWMGVWDSGPTYTIVELTQSRLVLHALQQNFDCTNPIGSGYFTLIFERVSELYSNCYNEGCTDAVAVNFDASANVDDGSCVFFPEDCTTLGQDEWLDYESGAYPVEGVFVMEGTQINESFVIHLASTFQDPISGSVLPVMSFESTAINGLPAGVVTDTSFQIMVPNEQQCISLSGVTYGPGSHQLEIVGELTISLFGAPYSLGEVTVVQTLVVLPNEEGTFGCTYSYAANFNPLATMDDGSCVIAACTDPEACNYLSFATVDDGSCTYGQQPTEECQFDSNNDGLIGSSDLLDFLAAFGIECE